MYGIENILFDLDGTLTDPQEGFCLSIAFALTEIGRPIPPDAVLRACIGPPIEATFAMLLETDDSEAIQAAVQLYRQRYGTIGLFENAPYPGVAKMLQTLRALDKRLWVATSKPLPYAVQILQRFDLADAFEGVYGSELNRANTAKGVLIGTLLQEQNLQTHTTVMVGDRKHDILGARENGVTAIGVTYGYGTETELTEAGALVLCASPAEVLAQFIE